jgi:hypothetical protein
MIKNTIHNKALISPLREIDCRVELYSSTQSKTFTPRDAVKSFTVSREGQKKFFGFGVCQKLEMELVDKSRSITIQPGDTLILEYIAEGESVRTNPPFYITEVKRNENNNNITLTAYDALYELGNHTISEAELTTHYYTYNILAWLINKFNINFDTSRLKNKDVISLYYPNGANLDGTETVRAVLDAIAEAAQCIYYLDRNNKLIFRSLDRDGQPDLIINKSNYFTLESEGSRTLAAICSATELGDNVEARAADIEGDTQYIRDNPFLELRDDIAELLENGLSYVAGLEINQFNCKWRGNYLLEPGDKIGIVARDLTLIYSYLLDDSYTYSGGLVETSGWQFGDNEETATNSSTLGDALKKTFAKVDKVNKEIAMVAGETASIKITADAIANSVVKLDNDMAQVVAEVNTKVSAEDISFTIQKALEDGTEKVITTTGFTFNEEGLHISKENNEIATSITEDGMAVYKGNEEVLRADNLGVKAEDLHATTFLIIGDNSRIEDYGSSRTGCFWIGL